MADYDDLVDAYETNCTYDLNGSLAECKLFIAAVRKLLLFPEQSERDGERMRYSTERLKEELAKAEQWYAANKPSPAVGAVLASFERFRP